MASTYVNNLRLEEMATGEQSGTWGTKTNTNLELIGQVAAWGTRAIANASTDNITIADGAADADRCFGLKLTGGGQACTVTLLPNTSSKTWVMYNTTSYTLTFTCGSGANVAILAGQTKIIATDGLGSGGVVHDLLTAVNLAGTTQTAAVTTQGTLTVGVDDTGFDVKMFGAASGSYLLWDESADDLILAGAAGLSVAGGSVLASVDVTGVATAATFEPDGDTAAGDNAAIGYTSAEGLILTGQGSTSDVTLKNDADATVFTVPTGTDDILFPDSAKAMFGAGSDLQIYHNGSHSYISDQGTGSLILQTNNFSLQSADGGENLFASIDDGAVTLYYDNAVKLATVTGGVNITGELEADSLDIDGATQIDGTLSVGIDDTGYDVKFFGATSGSYMLWDESTDDLILGDAAGLGIGTTAPSSRLEISGAGDNTNVIVMSQGGAYKNSIQNLHSGTASVARMSFFVHSASDAQANVMSLLGNGNVGIGVTAPATRFHIKQLNNGEAGGFKTERSDTTAYSVIYMGGDDDLYIQNQANGDINFYTNSALAMSLSASGDLTLANAAGPAMLNETATATNPTLAPNKADLDTGVAWVSANIGSLVAGGTSAMRWSATGVGVLMSPSYALDVFAGGGTATQISRWADSTPTQIIGFYNSNSGANTPNTANATMTVRGMNTSDRSINAGGTVNASGADYAEYMTKADGCGTIAKGAVCGVDSDGKLTDVFANAHSFVIKSTDPSYVGGDKWGLASTDSDGNETMLEGAALEAARQKVDRISFSGQVPCTIAGDAAVGDYIIPQAEDDGIEAVAVSNPTFDQYRLAVGKVWKLNDSGKHTVAVKIG